MHFSDNLTDLSHGADRMPSPHQADTNQPPGFAWAFGMAAPGMQLFTTGLKQRAPAGPITTLGERTRRFFTGLQAAAPTALLVGALPFDRAGDDFLFMPETVSDTAWPVAARAQDPAPRWRATPEPDRDAYAASVARALKAIAAARESGPTLTKAVLSRSVRLETDAEIDPLGLWLNLQVDSTVTRFLTPVGIGVDGAMRRLVGATPELLVSRRGDRVVSHPLAGSARRNADPAEDEAASRALLASGKDRREHAFVVEAILDLLAPLCADLSAPGGPSLASTRTMWHLGTRIEARLRAPEETTAADLAALLHPTPAVAGTPRQAALDLIRDLESHDRGFYAGAVGWMNAGGDGDWHVALRCAEVEGRTVRAFAGAGIVEGSDPEAEADETSAKLLAILRALGVNEQGRLAAGAG